MMSVVFRIIVIESCSGGGFPLEEASEHCFLSIKVSFWCFGFIYCVVPLLFSIIFMFSSSIIDLVPYNLNNTFPIRDFQYKSTVLKSLVSMVQ